MLDAARTFVKSHCCQYVDLGHGVVVLHQRRHQAKGTSMGYCDATRPLRGMKTACAAPNANDFFSYSHHVNIIQEFIIIVG